MKTAKLDTKSLIERLGLKPLPLEGGYYRETYRSKTNLGGSEAGKQKAVSTAIFYLLNTETFSAFHRLPSDEIWHFYAGDPVNIYVINSAGHMEITRLCADLSQDETRICTPQLVVHAGDWQGAMLDPDGSCALLGCTVAPAFDFEDYEHGDRESLLKLFPQHKEHILKLTR